MKRIIISNCSVPNEILYTRYMRRNSMKHSIRHNQFRECAPTAKRTERATIELHILERHPRGQTAVEREGKADRKRQIETGLPCELLTGRRQISSIAPKLLWEQPSNCIKLR